MLPTVTRLKIKVMIKHITLQERSCWGFDFFFYTSVSVKTVKHVLH